MGKAMHTGTSSVEQESENSRPHEDWYTGQSAYIYAAKMPHDIDVRAACETLASSEAFIFGLDSNGRIYYRKNFRLFTTMLEIEHSISGLGMSVRDHDDYIKSNPGDLNSFAFQTALNLHLSENKLFNGPFEFPGENARLFLQPIAILNERDESYELYLPYIRIFKRGVIFLCLKSLSGFENETCKSLVLNQVNKANKNIKSVLACKEIFLAGIADHVSELPIREKLGIRKNLKTLLTATLRSPKQIKFNEQYLTAYELVFTEKLTIQDVASNLLTLARKSLLRGSFDVKINWLSPQRTDTTNQGLWFGKPLIYIERHWNQWHSASKNWAQHEPLVKAVLTRTHLSEALLNSPAELQDVRKFDDFNHFYTEAVSLLLTSGMATEQLDRSDAYSFENMIADVQTLNEAAMFIRAFYANASTDLDKCRTAIDVAKLEVKVMRFEEDLISTQKYGEISEFIDLARSGSQVKTLATLLLKKIDITRKALELDEKIASDSDTKRISIIFGVIASAALSPELIQPLAAITKIAPNDTDLLKIYSLIGSLIIVSLTVFVLRKIFRLFK
jgi:hypothetical protein